MTKDDCGYYEPETKECPMCDHINDMDNRYCVFCDFPFVNEGKD